MNDEAITETGEVSPVDTSTIEGSDSGSTRDSIIKAFDKVQADDLIEDSEQETQQPPEQQQADQEQEPVEDTKTTQVLSEESGETVPDETVPNRFSDSAKQEWGNTPQAVKDEITRAITEMENGIEEYRQAFEPYRQFDSQLKQTGQTFEEVVGFYTGMEDLLQRDPVAGLQQICANLGTTLNDVAGKVLNQTPEQSASQYEQGLASMREEMAALKNNFNGLYGHIQGRQQDEINTKIQEFKADKPRFNELSSDIALFLESGKANDLETAYSMAERLNPAPESAVQKQVQEPVSSPNAQTGKGKLSLNGAPSLASNVNDKKPSSTVEQAALNAWDAVMQQ